MKMVNLLLRISYRYRKCDTCGYLTRRRNHQGRDFCLLEWGFGCQIYSLIRGTSIEFYKTSVVVIARFINYYSKLIIRIKRNIIVNNRITFFKMSYQKSVNSGGIAENSSKFSDGGL